MKHILLGAIGLLVLLNLVDWWSTETILRVPGGGEGNPALLWLGAHLRLTIPHTVTAAKELILSTFTGITVLVWRLARTDRLRPGGQFLSLSADPRTLTALLGVGVMALLWTAGHNLHILALAGR
jgi:hypothetical protein